MKTERRFLIGRSLVRLIQRDRLPTKDFVERYLQSSAEIAHFVRLEPGASYIVLQRFKDGQGSEEKTKVPPTQADALLDLCAGKVVYRRTQVRIGQGQEALLDQFGHPPGLNLITLEFDGHDKASACSAPEWFGPEVTQNPFCGKPSIAVVGLPALEDVEVNNATIIAFVDHLEANASPRQPLGANSHSTPDGNTAASSISQEALPKLPSVVPFTVPASDDLTHAAHPSFDAMMTGLAQALGTGGAAMEQGADPHASGKQSAAAMPLLKRLTA